MKKPSVAAPAPAVRAGGVPAWAPAVVLLGFAIVAHLSFSRGGFNPTDDGFVLAYSRRVLAGEMPHRDFIAIRPVGSALLHAPVVLLGGDLTFWLSRLVVWLEFAAIAAAWMLAAAALAAPGWSLAGTLALSLLAAFLTSYHFAIMAWHSIDALALASIGIALAVRRAGAARVAGAVLLGASAVCRQNFLLVGPLALLLLGRGRDMRCWLALVAPWAAYALWLVAGGALPDALAQLGSKTDLIRYGIEPYLRSPHLWIGFALGAAAALLARVPRRARGAAVLAALGVALVLGTPMAAAVEVAHLGYNETMPFLLFGALAGAALGSLASAGPTAPARLAALALVVAWSTSVSIGITSPALAAGALAIALAAQPAAGGSRNLTTALLVLGVLAGAPQWWRARHELVYRDRPIEQLDRPLDHLLPGGRLLRTNLNTAAFLTDLRHAIALAGGERYAIVPDLAAWWVRAPQLNPLLLDWPQDTELGSPRLFQRVIRDLGSRRGRLTVIVQKCEAYPLCDGFIELRPSHYMIVAWVRANWTRCGETALFELYR